MKTIKNRILVLQVIIIVKLILAGFLYYSRFLELKEILTSVRYLGSLTKNHTELATTCQVSKKEIFTKPVDYKSGIFRIKPTLENAYVVQANIKPAIEGAD
jgi:hypothetical protein